MKAFTNLPVALAQMPSNQKTNINNITQNNYIESKEIIPQQTANQVTDLMNAQLQINTAC